MVKGQTTQWSKDRQHNDQMTDNTMIKRENTGQKTDNTMVKRQTTQ